MTLANRAVRVEDVKQLRGDTIFAEMVHVEAEISRLRNTSGNFENYIPLLRPIKHFTEWLGFGDGKYLAQIGQRRVGYHKVLLENLRAEVATGADKPCIQGNVLKDPESKHLIEGELLSVSLSMMAGADTSQPTVAWAMLVLSQRQDIQRKAFEAIIQTDSRLLSESDVSYSKVDYVDAFTKEIGRYYTSLKLGLPRATSDEVGAVWNGAVIPPKTLLFLNGWACSQGRKPHRVPAVSNSPKQETDANSSLDPKAFPDAATFEPERWLRLDSTHAHQFAFGMGSRMCIANHLAHKALYTAFLHLIAHFEILPAAASEGDPHVLDPLEGLLHKESFVATPRTCNVRLVPRDLARTRRVLGLE